MGFPGYAGWTVQLDPSAVATNRTVLDINTGAIQIGSTGGGTGVDWGASQLTEYLAQEATWGSTVVDYVFPNRTVTIPLIVQAWGATSFDTAMQQLREKVALFQREGGWIVRQAEGQNPMYADVVDAQLVFPDIYGETGSLEPDVTLTLICLPDFYGAEVTLDSATVTGVYSGVLQQSASPAVVAGDHPGRCRIQVADTSGNNQLGAIWGIRSRYYDSSSTAALVYEAEVMTPVNGAAVTGLSGASGGDVVQITSLPESTWVPFLSTTLTSGSAPLTHQGTYAVWVRAYSSTGTPEIQFIWGMGSLAAPVTNSSVTLPGNGAFYLLNLGTIQLTPPPVGSNEWFGAVQAFSIPGGDSVAIDEIFFQPLDESAGQMTYAPIPTSSGVAITSSSGTGADVTGVGTIAWANGGNLNAGGTEAALTTGTTSHYLEATNWGFSIPSGATILGITANVYRYQTQFSGNYAVVDSRVRLVKAGTIQTTDRALTGVLWPTSPTYKAYGSSSDLWGGTWAYSDINNSGFGIAIAAQNPGAQTCYAFVLFISMTIFYELGAGFVVGQDAVIYASENAEFRTEGMFRNSSAGTVYGPVSRVLGDLPRIPPSGLETRNVQAFVKLTRGDLNTVPDSGIDGLTVQTIYRPTYLFRP